MQKTDRKPRSRSMALTRKCEKTLELRLRGTRMQPGRGCFEATWLQSHVAFRQHHWQGI